MLVKGFGSVLYRAKSFLFRFDTFIVVVKYNL